MPRKETYSGPLSAQAQQDLVSEGIENFELPKSVVMKIAKSAIPDNVKLQKETVLSLVKGSTVFINYLAATAHDVAQSKQHKSISASDVLKALETIEFSDMINKLQSELTIYRELSKNDKGKKSTNGGSVSARKGPVAGGSSASAPVKGKNKEKANPGNPGIVPPPSLVSTPLDLPTAHSPMDMPMDVDYEAESASVPIARPFQIEREGEEPENDEAEDLVEDEDVQEIDEVGSEEEPEELEDKELIEGQELRKDAQGVEERTMVQDDD